MSKLREAGAGFCAVGAADKRWKKGMRATGRRYLVELAIPSAGMSQFQIIADPCHQVGPLPICLAQCMEAI